MFKRLLLGLLKGLVIGGAFGAAVFFGLSVQASGVEGALAYLLYAGVALVAGVLSGRPPWLKGAWVESLLKGLFGLAVGAGLYAVATKVFGNALAPDIAGAQHLKLIAQPLMMAPGIAAIYAALIELDNTGEEEAAAASSVRIRSVDDIKVDEDEEVEAPAAKPAAKARR